MYNMYYVYGSYYLTEANIEGICAIRCEKTLEREIFKLFSVVTYVCKS